MEPSRCLFSPRITRCMQSDCWGEDYLSHAELESANRVYTDDFLREMRDDGLNGIWVHLVLRETVRSSLFPKPDPQQLPRLNRLVERASRFDVKVYTYLCEPRALFADDPFWRKHPDIRGRAMLCESDNPHLSGIQYGLCTSTTAVKDFLEESCHNLFSNTPGLGGVFCITSSEFRTHCYQSYPYKLRKRPVLEEYARADFWRRDAMYRDPVTTVYRLHHLLDEALVCPRCLPRDPVDVVAEIIHVMNRGVKSAAPEAAVIVWSFAWHHLEAAPYARLISLLPRGVHLLADWEGSGGEKVHEILGERYPVDEYSLSYIGPSPRFFRQLRHAKRRGLKTMAKLQLSTTHELAAVPYLPVPYQLAEKIVRLKRHGVNGFLGCWIFGGDNTPMSKVAGALCRDPMPTVEEAIREVAGKLYGARNARIVARAWELFSEAWREYPFSVPMTWHGPLGYAVAFPFPLERFEEAPAPTENGWYPGGLPRDSRGRLVLTCHHLEHWVKPFGPHKVRKAFLRLLRHWRSGMRILANACAEDSANQSLLQAWALARHIELSVQSTIHIVRFYTLWPKCEKSPLATRTEKFRELREILLTERKSASEEVRLLSIEPRIGYHAEGHAFLFDERDLAYKIRTMKKTADRMKEWMAKC